MFSSLFFAIWKLKKNLFIFLICGKLLYNSVLVSAIQQYKSVIIIYIYIYIPSLLSLLLLPPPHPSRSSQSARLGSLGYIATSHLLSVLHMVVCICQCYFLNLSHLHLLPLCPHVHSRLGSSVPFFYIPYIGDNI